LVKEGMTQYGNTYLFDYDQQYEPAGVPVNVYGEILKRLNHMTSEDGDFSSDQLFEVVGNFGVERVLDVLKREIMQPFYSFENMQLSAMEEVLFMGADESGDEEETEEKIEEKLEPMNFTFIKVAVLMIFLIVSKMQVVDPYLQTKLICDELKIEDASNFVGQIKTTEDVSYRILLEFPTVYSTTFAQLVVKDQNPETRDKRYALMKSNVREFISATQNSDALSSKLKKILTGKL
jgi:hypothetical protein